MSSFQTRRMITLGNKLRRDLVLGDTGKIHLRHMFECLFYGQSHPGIVAEVHGSGQQFVTSEVDGLGWVSLLQQATEDVIIYRIAQKSQEVSPKEIHTFVRASTNGINIAWVMTAWPERLSLDIVMTDFPHGEIRFWESYDLVSRLLSKELPKGAVSLIKGVFENEDGYEWAKKPGSRWDDFVFEEITVRVYKVGYPDYRYMIKAGVQVAKIMVPGSFPYSDICVVKSNRVLSFPQTSLDSDYILINEGMLKDLYHDDTRYISENYKGVLRV